MRTIMQVAAVALCVGLSACGSSDSSAEGVGGAGGAVGSGGNGGNGPACSGVTGKFTLTATRDAGNAGSCPATVSYGTGAAVTITSQAGDGGTTYGVDLGACTVNVSGCHVSATCVVFKNSTTFYNAELSLDVTDTGLTGTDQWTGYKGTNPACSANWHVTGTRQ